ncbi:hypothetical protein V496_05034 [Pseudogymnoascus sp. VKM F-4515 (FW-2607)]|nr:hypothetical protein V496_05034 [Pseudogymnoascus sp. VKM F-4515 (FW-2607)]
MSWQAYVDTSLIDSGTVNQAVIFSLQGDKVLASSTGFMVSFTECAEILKILGDKGTGPNVIQARNDGFAVAGTSYYAVRADARSFANTQHTTQKPEVVEADEAEPPLESCHTLPVHSAFGLKSPD